MPVLPSIWDVAGKLYGWVEFLVLGIKPLHPSVSCGHILPSPTGNRAGLLQFILFRWETLPRQDKQRVFSTGAVCLTFLAGYDQGWYRRMPDDVLGH